MKHFNEEVESSEPTMDLAAFEAERDRVCEDFGNREVAKQPGQLGRMEYLLVGFLLAVSFALVLLIQ
ncbi:MAG: hypothetical protein ABWX63_12165 [Paeniglutamicibacter terrestris]|nr:hypothetical protein CGQ24_09885 [Arthrobacter sp. 7749]